MAFCPDDNWDGNFERDDSNLWEDDWEGNEEAWQQIPEGQNENEEAEIRPAVTVGAKWRGDPSRRHRRLRNPTACEDLRMAILHGSVEGVADILNTCDDVHVDDVLRNGLTPLCIAADSAQSRVLEILLSCGATTDAGQSAFEGIYPPLVAACNSLHADDTRVQQCVDALIAHGVNVDKRDSRQMTALMYASKHGRRSVVRKLLASSADTNSQDTLGWAALCHAAHSGQLEVVQELLAAGADPLLACFDGQLAEDLAFSNEHAEVADYLTTVVAGSVPVVPDSYVRPLMKELEDSVRDADAGYYQFGDLEMFLLHLSLTRFAKVLLDKGITLQQLMTMNEAELEQAGVSQVGARMKIIEESCRSMLAMWAKPPPEDDVKKRGILKTKLTGLDAKWIAANLERHVSYTTSAFDFLHSQLPGVLTTARTSDEVEECLTLMDEANEAASDVLDSAVEIEQTLNQLTGTRSGPLYTWLVGGLGVAVLGGAVVYLVRGNHR